MSNTRLVNQLFEAIENRELKKADSLISKLKTDPSILETINTTGDTLFILSAKKGNLSCLKTLLGMHADVNGLSHSGYTALQYAARYGHSKCVDALIAARANVNTQNETNGATALMCAAHSNHGPCIDLLIAARAELNTQHTTHHTALTFAAQNNYASCVEKLLNANATPNIVFNDRETALWHAVRNQNLKCANLLIEAKAEVNHQDYEENTFVMNALSSEHIPILNILIAARANVDLKNLNGDTALIQSAKNNFIAGLNILLEAKASQLIHTRNGLTPLMVAARYDSLKCIKPLLETKAEINEQKKEGAFAGYTALTHTAEMGSNRTLKYLLSEKAEVNVIDHEGRTPLHYAVAECHVACILELIFNGARCNIKDSKNMAALDIAMQAPTRKNTKQMIRVLLGHSHLTDAQKEKAHEFLKPTEVEKIQQFETHHKKNLYQAIDKGTSEKMPTVLIDIVNQYLVPTENNFKNKKLAFFKPTTLDKVLKIEEQMAETFENKVETPEQKQAVKTYELRSKRLPEFERSNTEVTGQHKKHKKM